MFLSGFPRTPLTIRQWSALLVVACILPAIIATTLLIYFSYKRERAGMEKAGVEIAGALMQTIDRELSSAQGALQALGTSPYLTTGELELFYRQALEVVSHRPGNNLVLCSTSGQQMINTLESYGAPLPLHGNPKQIRRVAESGKPTVSDLYMGTVSHRYLVSVDVPVQREGAVKYVLSMQFFPERLGELLAGQRISKEWVVAVLDSSGIVVARTHEQERFVGKSATPTLIRAMSQAAEGSFEDHTLDGLPAVAVFSRSSVSNWTVVIGMHRTALTQELGKTISWLIAGALLLFALGLGLAKLIGERIAVSIRGLVEPAMALGYDTNMTIPPLRLREADDVGHALLQASRLLRERTAERDLAECAERELREAKREVEQREAFLRGIFEETPDAVFLVAQDGRVVRANAEADRLFGGAPDHRLASLMIDDLLFYPETKNHQTLCHTLFAASARRAIEGSSQLQARRAGGKTFPVDVMISPLHTVQGDLVITTVRDITERKRTEEALSILNKRLELATLAGGIAVWEWNLGTGALVWDERMHELYQVPKEAASHRYDMWRQCVHPDDLECAERELDKALAGDKEFATEFRIVWPDNQVRIIRANAVVTRDAAGKPVRMTGVNIDVTETRQKEDAINAALREKETLLRELYHRVKNNLQVIASLFSLQVRTLPEGPARIALAEGANRVKAMALVHEKLYQSGSLSSIALDDYVFGLCHQLEQTVSAEQHGIVVSVDIAPLEIGLETAVPLGLLLNELIYNSLKHAFPGGRGGHIVVRVERAADSMMHVCVSDDGVGFPSEIDPTFSRTLGLKLVAALSRQLGGRFSLENRGGACASLIFPLNERMNAEKQAGERG